MTFLTGNNQMRNTARSALKQGMWAAGGATMGGMVGGPIGGMVGGIAGSIIGFVKSDPYDGMLHQLTNLESHRQTALLKEVGGVLMAAGATTQQLGPDMFRDTLQNLAQQESVRNGVWRACMQAVETM